LGPVAQIGRQGNRALDLGCMPPVLVFEKPEELFQKKQIPPTLGFEHSLHHKSYSVFIHIAGNLAKAEQLPGFTLELSGGFHMRSVEVRAL
jgi:hypothetical protein